MTKPHRSHDEATAELLREDPALAAEYLDAVLEDGDQAEVLIALRHIVNARSSIQKVAEQTELNATTLYRTLSPTGNPELRSLMKVLGAVGLRLSIEPVRA
ncbi:putative addiction module antidote protein [Lysobacter sp. A6]|uniref:Addiction module antidote protein n=1 Tax=Noviluteimonas lactosilytica TaxID=2888523 RepID=A0ABS8JJK3_9GAMM|nr:addiction module antidote protein [Lysobacter lactosilyticus]MCC8363675.1 putative addiction module antidote protein [Lysobacter lactosilyticus]